MLETLKLIYRNLVGWNTSRKIIVFESDDWGSVRIHSKNDYECMVSMGIPIQQDHFTRYDCLECEEDLIELFEVLKKHVDSTGRHPVFTSLCTLVNPVFEKIEQSGFREYIYETFDKTCRNYPNHKNVPELWKRGIQQRLFVPQFHGREHINPMRWLRLLAAGDRCLRVMFEHNSYGCKAGVDINGVPSYLPAFDAETEDDMVFIKNSIREGLEMFKGIMGYQATYFVPCSGTAISELENTLQENGIKYVNSGRIDTIPIGNGAYKTRINWLGKTNKIDQIYIPRNCFFEPSEGGAKDYISTTLKEIEMAFLMRKPAIIGTHRVNYVGYIDENNRVRGLKQLDQLLTEILKRWPNIEFLTTPELGELISR